MDEMTWTDPQLKARYEENSRKLEHLKETLPNLYSEDALPYKVFTTNSVHGIQRMRLIWLKEHHPQWFREMMMANVLEEHLRDIETRTRERQAQIMDQLMESRHLLNRTDCLKAAPQLTDLDRLNGMNEAQSESMSMAIHESWRASSIPRRAAHASPRERAEANIAAIQTLKKLGGDNGGRPSAKQMDTLRGYSGWGGCADAFSDKPEWRTIRGTIEQALTPEEYAQARASTLTAYYTPGPVVKAMWTRSASAPRPSRCWNPDAARAISWPASPTTSRRTCRAWNSTRSARASPPH